MNYQSLQASFVLLFYFIIKKIIYHESLLFSRVCRLIINHRV
jgi:hypothetical protein